MWERLRWLFWPTTQKEFEREEVKNAIARDRYVRQENDNRQSETSGDTDPRNQQLD